MALNVWTKPSGYNFGTDPGRNQTVTSGNFVPGYRYVITSIGTTNFKLIGAAYNTVGTVFTATQTGITAGPIVNGLQTAGSGTASKVAFPERVTTVIQLPTNNDTGVTYSVITGTLPPGLRIKNNTIVGTPFEVARVTDFTFCIRASKTVNNVLNISDRTYTITIEGDDPPEFLTPSGDLSIGDNNQLYALDSTYVDFQIQAHDFDTAVGQTLNFFIARNDGELPPGLILTTDGRIVGFVEPVTVIRPEDGNGTYDNSYYDAVAFDFAFLPTNGYDSYIYDNVFYDYSTSNRAPRKLNRRYEFTVSVTDGDSIAKRTFKIFVVGDDYFRADNVNWLDGTGLFTADVTYLRKPIWITAPDLGLYRANNYLTIPLEVYDKENVRFTLGLVNADLVAVTKQKLPTDNLLGSTSVTVYKTGTAPEFAQWLTFNGLFEGVTSKIYQISNVTAIGVEQYRLTITTPLLITIPDDIEFFIGTLPTLPAGTSFDENSCQIYGTVPYQPAITTSCRFTINATRFSDKGETVVSPRIFSIRIIGEVESTITWHTSTDLGTVNANFISSLSVNASSTVPGAIVLYRITSGRLPPGLTLDLDGEIVGKVNQYGDGTLYRSNWIANRSYNLNDVVKYNNTYYKALVNNSGPSFNIMQWESHTFDQSGLTAFDFDGVATTFDNQTTTVDRVYNFNVEARDQYGYSATTKSFNITVLAPNQIVYSNIKVKPYLKLDQRSIWKNFINDTSVFVPDTIYRPNDSNFGVQTELSMVVYAGIETTEAAKYIGAMGLNHKRKRFHFGTVSKAVAYKTGTNTAVYEVIYVTMVDPLEPGGKKLPQKLTKLGLQKNKISTDSSNVFWAPGFTPSNDPSKVDQLSIPAPASERPSPIISVDSTGYFVSNPYPDTYFPNSVSIWRDKIKSVGETERNYLPLWMRSIQPGSKQELGFTLAVPLCFCKVGTADSIMLNIKNANFNFKQIDYTTDRYIIDAVEGSTGDKYLVFRNDRITV